MQGSNQKKIVTGTAVSDIASKTKAPRRKAAYHHGDLRGALIDAAHALIRDKGPEGFTLADACRLAGVSTAAPYRHFADRGALIEAVAQRGFVMLRERTSAARDSHPAGTEDSIVAMGQAYVAFATDEPAVFKLMFGAHPDVQTGNEAPASGRPCFQVLLDGVDAWIARTGLEGMTTLDVALPLWIIVHGTSYLQIDKDFCSVAPKTDVDGLIRRTTLATLKGLQTAR